MSPRKLYLISERPERSKSSPAVAAGPLRARRPIFRTNARKMFRGPWRKEEHGRGRDDGSQQEGRQVLPEPSEQLLVGEGEKRNEEDEDERRDTERDVGMKPKAEGDPEIAKRPNAPVLRPRKNRNRVKEKNGTMMARKPIREKLIVQNDVAINVAANAARGRASDNSSQLEVPCRAPRAIRTTRSTA